MSHEAPLERTLGVVSCKQKVLQAFMHHACRIIPWIAGLVTVARCTRSVSVWRPFPRLARHACSREHMLTLSSPPGMLCMSCRQHAATVLGGSPWSSNSARCTPLPISHVNRAKHPGAWSCGQSLRCCTRCLRPEEVGMPKSYLQALPEELRAAARHLPREPP